MDDQIPTQAGWERELVSKLAQMNLKEQRARRRWSVFFKLVWLALAVAVFAMLMGWIGRGGETETIGRHTALVKLEGEIDDKGMASAEKINTALRAAFGASDSVGVILSINSPGGSPVQSARIYNEIKRLRKDNPEKPLYVVVDELCASGGYFVAAAGDKIYVDGASLVGSIGVVYQGFGADKLLEKIGVENRTVTAGENKAFMDPFSPQKPEHKAHLEAMLGDVHQQFIKAVRDGRGDRLKANTPGLFSGLIWTGNKAIENGLVDAVGSIDSVARDVVKAEDLVDYSIEENAFDKFSRRLGASFGAGVMQSMSKLSWK
ncbi:MAG: S49 family peptidase [Betaproteobacteria bacterium]|nr:MAG: S49 family peptidase [Betaproteobacteria bacterium]TAG50274.1 MAG: S49 family peptidase [Betaproteobacteria bacterium]